MEAFLVSTGVVALGEMGDKTQLLAIVLAAAFRRPMPIILGILVATVVNHAVAGAVGGWVASRAGPGDPALGDRGVLPGHGRLDVDPGQAGRRSDAQGKAALWIRRTVSSPLRTRSRPSGNLRHYRTPCTDTA